jgi:precorrin-2 dehydrogenase
MFPILVDVRAVNVALVGNGEAALRRLQLLDADHARVAVYAPTPLVALAAAAGDRIIRRLPTADELCQFQLLFIANLPKADAGNLASLAREAGILVNTEDDVELSDFHVPAIVRRGDLTITVSTGGASPALARILKRRLEGEFGENWAARVEEVATWRRVWRAQGLAGSEITVRTENALNDRGWLS